MAECRKTTLRAIPEAPALAKVGEKSAPGMRETLFILLQKQEFGPIKGMGQQAADELADIISDFGESSHYRHAAVRAIREIMGGNESLDARKPLRALRAAARNVEMEKCKEVGLLAALVFKEISGVYPSQCNTYHYKEDRG